MRPVSSYADGPDHSKDGHNQDSGHHDSGSHDSGHSHDGGHHDRSYVGIGFSVWPDNYNYSASYYPPEDAVLVAPPIYQPVVVNGITYYVNDGTYYVYNGYSYQEVAPPVTVVQQPVTVEQPPTVVDSQTTIAPAVEDDTFTINIPNNKGGYTAVMLKKSGNGFIGPQGEFYPEFPKVSQLEVIYGK